MLLAQNIWKERNRDLEIATCAANHPGLPLRLQTRFRNRGSFQYPEIFQTNC